MSRITADVIDVLENEQTRVEILDIDGKDPEELITKPKLYAHKLVIGYKDGDVNKTVSFYPIYSSKSTKITNAEELVSVANIPNNDSASIVGVDSEIGVVFRLSIVNSQSKHFNLIKYGTYGSHYTALYTNATIESDTIMEV